MRRKASKKEITAQIKQNPVEILKEVRRQYRRTNMSYHRSLYSVLADCYEQYGSLKENDKYWQNFVKEGRRVAAFSYDVPVSAGDFKRITAVVRYAVSVNQSYNRANKYSRVLAAFFEEKLSRAEVLDELNKCGVDALYNQSTVRDGNSETARTAPSDHAKARVPSIELDGEHDDFAAASHGGRKDTFSPAAQPSNGDNGVARPPKPISAASLASGSPVMRSTNKLKLPASACCSSGMEPVVLETSIGDFRYMMSRGEGVFDMKVQIYAPDPYGWTRIVYLGQSID